MFFFKKKKSHKKNDKDFFKEGAIFSDFDYIYQGNSPAHLFYRKEKQHSSNKFNVILESYYKVILDNLVFDRNDGHLIYSRYDYSRSTRLYPIQLFEFNLIKDFDGTRLVFQHERGIASQMVELEKYYNFDNIEFFLYMDKKLIFVNKKDSNRLYYIDTTTNKKHELNENLLPCFDSVSLWGNANYLYFISKKEKLVRFNMSNNEIKIIFDGSNLKYVSGLCNKNGFYFQIVDYTSYLKGSKNGFTLFYCDHSSEQPIIILNNIVNLYFHRNFILYQELEHDQIKICDPDGNNVRIFYKNNTPVELICIVDDWVYFSEIITIDNNSFIVDDSFYSNELINNLDYCRMTIDGTIKIRINEVNPYFDKSPTVSDEL